MNTFMNENFLLKSKTAVRLYHEIAKEAPILDYHCHLSSKDIYDDVSFKNITRLWLCDNGSGDHYKWRLMRACGVQEKYITGDADDKEKFREWANSLTRCIGNPVYSFSHLELQRYFGFKGSLNSDNWEEVWNLCNQKLKEPSMSARNLIKNSGVTLVCTTDDPIDSLIYHQKLKEDKSFAVQVLPTFRPDKAMNVEAEGYKNYLELLEISAKVKIASFVDLMNAIKIRVDFFDKMGCKSSDHALEYVMYNPTSEEEIELIFKKVLKDEKLNDHEIAKFKTAFMLKMASFTCNKNWAMQIHYGCKRNNNGSKFDKLGADTGYDCIYNVSDSAQLTNFLNDLESKSSLPKTIVYSLNPSDNASIITALGCFQSEGINSKMQHGAAWWFNDHKKGMLDQMTTLASDGVLGNFIGMLTDSRSFISYPRHEYFRRLLCDLIGEYVENGEYPDDFAMLSILIKDICYNNAVRYFEFNLKTI